jgi:hypothetical protein
MGPGPRCLTSDDEGRVYVSDDSLERYSERPKLVRHRDEVVGRVGPACGDVCAPGGGWGGSCDLPLPGRASWAAPIRIRGPWSRRSSSAAAGIGPAATAASTAASSSSTGTAAGIGKGVGIGLWIGIRLRWLRQNRWDRDRRNRNRKIDLREGKLCCLGVRGDDPRGRTRQEYRAEHEDNEPDDDTCTYFHCPITPLVAIVAA